jgi:uncharacterized spore protein YtfJ
VDIPGLLERIGEHVNVRRAFGPAYEHEGAMLVPVAIVVGGGGGGNQPSEREAEGGGFGGVVYPLGAYVMRQNSVRYVPTYEATFLAIGVLSFLRFLIGRSRGRTGAR